MNADEIKGWDKKKRPGGKEGARPLGGYNQDYIKQPLCQPLVQLKPRP